MLNVMLLSMTLLADDVAFDGLRERSIVQLINQHNESSYRAVKGVDGGTLTVVDVGTLEEQKFQKSQLKEIRTNVSDRMIVEAVGIGPWIAWHLQPIFAAASERQTVASVQQAAVYVTANPYSGIMVGDEVDVFRLGETIKDPNTGEVLETPEQKIAKLEVISMSPKLVTCRATGEFVVELKVGDVIRPVQPRTTVAVLPFMNSAGRPVQSGVNMADDVTNAMTNIGVPTLERARTLELLAEQIRQLSGIYDGPDVSRVGKLLGAATLISGRLIESTEKRRVTILSLRLLDVRTGTILKTLELELSTPKLKMSAVSVFNQLNGSEIAPSDSVIANSIGMKFVLIRSGEFMMGSPDTEPGRRPDENLHSVTLTKDFEMAINEVTQGQYEQIVGRNPSRFKSADNPVDNVSWDDAMAFCHRLNRIPAERSAGYVYRLPTEAEWEYSCRAGEVGAYSFGDAPTELTEYAWYDDNSGDKRIDRVAMETLSRKAYYDLLIANNCRSHNVGIKSPNAIGLHDLHGNHWEWCLDFYADLPIASQADPAGPASGTERVIRGGSWDSPPEYCRSASRLSQVPTARTDSLTFRVIRTR